MPQHAFPNIRHAVQAEIIKAIKRHCKYEKEEAAPELIAFTNGYVNVKEMDEEGRFTLHKHTPDIFFTNVIPHNYNPNVNITFISETFGTYANQDPDIIKILEEIPGMCLYRSSPQGIDSQAFVLTGTKSNGKSTYLNLLYNFLGRENVSATDPQRFGERFDQAALCYKLANIVADLNEDTIRNAGLFKAIVSGDAIEGEEKYGTKFSFNPFCTLIFSCNNIPNIRDDSEAILRRLTIVPFCVEFQEFTADRSIGQKLMTEENIEALAILALRGLNRILTKNDGSVTQSKTFKSLPPDPRK